MERWLQESLKNGKPALWKVQLKMRQVKVESITIQGSLTTRKDLKESNFRADPNECCLSIEDNHSLEVLDL